MSVRRQRLHQTLVGHILDVCSMACGKLLAATLVTRAARGRHSTSDPVVCCFSLLLQISWPMDTCFVVVEQLIAAREATSTEQTASGFRAVASLSCWTAPISLACSLDP